MAKFVYIIGTADTKLEELLWLKSCLRSASVDSHVIDVSTGSSNAFHTNNQVDINATQIAAYHPDGIDAVFCGERGRAVTAMATALTHFCGTRWMIFPVLSVLGIRRNGIDNVCYAGNAYRYSQINGVHYGIGQCWGYVGGVDIAMLYTVTDLSGLNYLSRTILANAANMIAGAVNSAIEHDHARKPVLGLTMFGVTTPCINQLIASLGEQFDPLVFHATGNGGTSMERLVENREIVGVLDITLTEAADLLFGGVLACPETRLDCIAQTQTPWVGSAGALDMVNFSGRDSIPERYAHRQFVEHNAQVTLMRTTPEENYQLGVWIGNKLNLCEGPVRFIIPEGGFSALDAPGQPFFDLQARQAFAEGLSQRLSRRHNARLSKRLTTSMHLSFARL